MHLVATLNSANQIYLQAQNAIITEVSNLIQLQASLFSLALLLGLSPSRAAMLAASAMVRKGRKRRYCPHFDQLQAYLLQNLI